MQRICGATASDIGIATLMMWESYDYVRNSREKDFFYNLLLNEPGFEPEQLRLLWDGDRVAATVMVANRTMFDGKENVRLGGIGNVAVHPDFRGKGYSLALLEDAIDYMGRIGCQVSTLYTGHRGLYERVGYVQVPGRGFVKGHVSGEAVEFMRTKDWRAAKDLFESSISRLEGGMVRSAEYWEKGVAGKHLDAADIVYSEDRTAYVIATGGAEQGSIQLLDGGYADKLDQLTDLLKTAFAGRYITSPGSDFENPVLLGVKSAVEEPLEESACGLFARTLGGRAMPKHFFDMSVDGF